MKTIYFENAHSQPITVSDDGYELIKQLIETSKACSSCGFHYDAANPEVARNLCLVCFLGDKRNIPLEYVGSYTNKTTYNEYLYYTFMAPDGHMWESSPTSYHNEARESARTTLAYWDFILPGSVVIDGVERFLSPEWSIYGDVREPVVVAVNTRHDSGKSFVFLLYKDDQPRELNKRKGEIRKLFAEARKRLEATKDAKGYYHPSDGWEFSHEVYDSNLYEFIVQIERERLAAGRTAGRTAYLNWELSQGL